MKTYAGNLWHNRYMEKLQVELVMIELSNIWFLVTVHGSRHLENTWPLHFKAFGGVVMTINTDRWSSEKYIRSNVWDRFPK